MSHRSKIRFIWFAFVLSSLVAGVSYSFVTVTQQFIDGMHCVGCV